MTLVARNRIVILGAALAVIAAMFVTASPAAAGAPTCFGRSATIVARPGVTTHGTSGPDVIVGTSGPDVIKGHGGADLICSLDGNDRVYGNWGADWIDVGPGDDIAYGGRSNDHIYGGTGKDLLRGRRGADTINGQRGIDQCRGGRGVDSLSSCNEPASGVLSSAESEMYKLVQGLRSANGAGGLKVSIGMSDVARDWSKRLPSGFYHNSNVGSQIPSGWTAWGENIAYNSSVKAAFNALVKSPGHLANMINPIYTHVGIGIHVQGGTVYVTQVFARY